MTQRFTTRFTILGCGSSGGVPRPALGWGVCDPKNPKNRRRRCSLLVEQSNDTGGVTRVMIDTSPDLREQMLDADITKLDAVFYTHDHADHTHGIDDLRGLFIRHRKRIDIYMDEPTSYALHHKFGYCFIKPAGSEYPPICTEHRLIPGEAELIEGEGGPLHVLPILQNHGEINSIGYRFGDVAYSCDLKDLPPDSAEALMGLDLWIVDALRYTPHPSHFSLSETLTWIERLKPKRAILTDLHSDLDYETLRKELPPNVVPAYDGMRFEA
jgi:phosphoribosyl 1,2-cyclic phosphate phosphodiesterase